MRSKRVKLIISLVVIVIVIVVILVYIILNKPAKPMQTTPQFATEETVDNPALVEEEFKWLDNTNISVDPILITEDVVLRSEPRDASSEVMKLTKDMQGKRVAISTDLDGNELGWCRVFVKGKAGYLNIMTFDYILPIDNIEIEDDNLPDELAKELEGRQITIIEPEEKEEEAEAPIEEEEPVEKEETSIVTPKEEATPTPTPAPAPSTEPKKEETASPAPTQAPAQEAPQQTQPSGGITPEGQALLNQIIADGGTLGNVEMTHQESQSMGETGNVWE